MKRATRTALGCLLWSAAAQQPAAPQSALERSPNVSGGWTGAPHQLHFNLVHRFNQSGPPERQVQNRPTFLAAYSTPWGVLAGVHYATRSALVARVPNEWELFLRAAPWGRRSAAPTLQLGWNAAARSLDGEAGTSVRAGPATLLGAVRALSADAVDGRAAAHLALAAVVHLSRNIALAGDGGFRLAGAAVERPWSAALQLHIPTTPHTMSLHATNADAATLHSASRGGGSVRWGFEFTVPVTPARFARRGSAAPAAHADPAGVARVAIRNLRYERDTVHVAPGGVVEWRNEDPLDHTVTALDGAWDSGLIAPGARWSRRFTEPGVHHIVCTPHPFMRAVVVVR